MAGKDTPSKTPRSTKKKKVTIIEDDNNNNNNVRKKLDMTTPTPKRKKGVKKIIEDEVSVIN